MIFVVEELGDLCSREIGPSHDNIASETYCVRNVLFSL